MLGLQATVFHTAIAINKKCLDWNHIILGLPLVISNQSRLENKITHMNIGSANLPPPIPNHPTFINYFRHGELTLIHNYTDSANSVSPIKLDQQSLQTKLHESFNSPRPIQFSNKQSQFQHNLKFNSAPQYSTTR